MTELTVRIMWMHPSDHYELVIPLGPEDTFNNILDKVEHEFDEHLQALAQLDKDLPELEEQEHLTLYLKEYEGDLDEPLLNTLTGPKKSVHVYYHPAHMDTAGAKVYRDFYPTVRRIFKVLDSEVKESTLNSEVKESTLDSASTTATTATRKKKKRKAAAVSTTPNAPTDPSSPIDEIPDTAVAPTSLDPDMGGTVTAQPSDVEDIGKKLTYLLGKVGQLDGQVGQLNGQVGQLNGQVGQLNGKVDVLERKNKDLKRENKDLKKEVGALKKENEELKKEVGALKKENEDLKAEVDRLSEKADSTKKALENEIEDRKAAHTMTTKELWALKADTLYPILRRHLLNLGRDEVLVETNVNDWKDIQAQYDINHVPALAHTCIGDAEWKMLYSSNKIRRLGNRSAHPDKGAEEMAESIASKHGKDRTTLANIYEYVFKKRPKWSDESEGI